MTWILNNSGCQMLALLSVVPRVKVICIIPKNNKIMQGRDHEAERF